MLATITQVLDTTIANVALPSMTADLGESQDTINRVPTKYILSSAITMPATGWLADRQGKREVLLISIIGFVAIAITCGLAWSLPSMVVFRLLQGLFGAAIVPLSQTFLLDINLREQAGNARAMWGTGLSLTSLSLWKMTDFAPQTDAGSVVRSGGVQGLGLGPVFEPLTTVAFAKLEPRFRADATRLCSLARSIGSSIGISQVTAALARNVQTSRAEVRAFIRPYPVLAQVSPGVRAGDPAAVAMMDGMVNVQAAIVVCIDDLYLNMWVSLCAMTLAAVASAAGAEVAGSLTAFARRIRLREGRAGRGFASGRPARRSRAGSRWIGRHGSAECQAGRWKSSPRRRGDG